MAGRATSGAICGAVLFSSERRQPFVGAAIGAVTAILGAYTLFVARREVASRGLADPIVGLCEDIAVVGASVAALAGTAAAPRASKELVTEDMKGRTVLITGATNGIGLAAARQLCEQGANLIIGARVRERGESVVRELSTLGAGSVDLVVADLASMEEVRRMAQEVSERHPELHVLLNNAGAVYRPRQTTVDGFEMTFAVNHLAPFLLTNLLLPTLTASAPSRVVTVASDAAKGARISFDDIGREKHYSPFGAYGQSKLANILFTYELARRTEGNRRNSKLLSSRSGGNGFQQEQRGDDESGDDLGAAISEERGQRSGDPGLSRILC